MNKLAKSTPIKMSLMVKFLMEPLLLVGGYHTVLNHYGLPWEINGAITTVLEVIAIYSVIPYDLDDSK